MVGSFEGGTAGLHARFGEEKNLLLLTPIEPRFLRYQVRSLVNVKTALSRIPFLGLCDVIMAVRSHY